MEQYIIQLICDTFNQCFGLQDCVKKGLPYSLETLSRKSGIRLQYLKENLEEINKIIVN